MSNFYTIKEAIAEIKSKKEDKEEPFKGLAYYQDREIFWSNVDLMVVTSIISIIFIVVFFLGGISE